ncbi:MAG: hypothetical protein JSU70_16230 [Phycisphaerales bacterium]|nr:MAG: hypothetical protein JSU70_16230 [Phycisphaerales bacterium]
MDTDARHSIAKLYYYVTPLFILLDYLGVTSVRAAILDSMPVYKNLYYGFCIVCAVSMYAVPRCTAIVALFESAINFLMTIMGLFVPYVQYVTHTDDVLDADWEIVNVFTIPRIVNLILAGAIATLVFKGSLRTLGVDTGLPGPISGKTPRARSSESNGEPDL